VSGMGGSPNDQQWQLFAAGDCGGAALGELGVSQFHISCSDSSMNGPEDCGTAQGNGKNDDPNLVDGWLLEGIRGDGGELQCSAP
jgi:serine-aspartate repeat-containing protein C/D/E